MTANDCTLLADGELPSPSACTHAALPLSQSEGPAIVYGRCGVRSLEVDGAAAPLRLITTKPAAARCRTRSWAVIRPLPHQHSGGACARHCCATDRASAGSSGDSGRRFGASAILRQYGTLWNAERTPVAALNYSDAWVGAHNIVDGGRIGGIGRFRVAEPQYFKSLKEASGGWGGIRTHGTLTRTAVFKTAAFNHSATHPTQRHQARIPPLGGTDGEIGTRMAPDLCFPHGRVHCINRGPLMVRADPPGSRPLRVRGNAKVRSFKAPWHRPIAEGKAGR
jgi:hypothetical protein